MTNPLAPSSSTPRGVVVPSSLTYARPRQMGHARLPFDNPLAAKLIKLLNEGGFLSSLKPTDTPFSPLSNLLKNTTALSSLADPSELKNLHQMIEFGAKNPDIFSETVVVGIMSPRKENCMSSPEALLKSAIFASHVATRTLNMTPAELASRPLEVNERNVVLFLYSLALSTKDHKRAFEIIKEHENVLLHSATSSVVQLRDLSRYIRPIVESAMSVQDIASVYYLLDQHAISPFTFSKELKQCDDISAKEFLNTHGTSSPLTYKDIEDLEHSVKFRVCELLVECGRLNEAEELCKDNPFAVSFFKVYAKSLSTKRKDLGEIGQIEKLAQLMIDSQQEPGKPRTVTRRVPDINHVRINAWCTYLLKLEESERASVQLPEDIKSDVEKAVADPKGRNRSWLDS